MTFKIPAYATCLVLSVLPPAQAKTKEIPAPNLPWQQGEVLVVGQSSSYRVGKYDNGEIEYRIRPGGIAELISGSTDWGIVCGKDSMTDAVNCIVSNDGAGFGLMFLKGSSTPFGLHITGQ